MFPVGLSGRRYPRSTMSSELPPGPSIRGDTIRFRLPAGEGSYREVRLCQEIQRPRNGPELRPAQGGRLWEVDFPLPEADRMEYQFEVVYPSGERERIVDPVNPNVVRDPHGDRSVVELPGYVQPVWLQDALACSELRKERLPSSGSAHTIPVTLWSAGGLASHEPAPLLIVHDGPDYAACANLITFLEHMTSAGRLPPMRAALLAPVGDRNELYSGSPGYGWMLSREALPALARMAPSPPGRDARVGMGASLGALAMLHAHRAVPAAFGALFLQSGSFFQYRLDNQEAGFARFERITGFVGTLLSTRRWAHPVPTVMTCGAVEENLANNRAVCEALEAQGYEVALSVNRDAHNWVAWRDAFEPHLASLLQRMWT